MSGRSYYGHPVVKPPVWKPEVPFYLFTGGLAGASAGLAFGASLTGDRELERRAWAVSLVAVAASPVLLIADLGKPGRFYNMLRVFKVTSPMNVGSWLLAAAGGATGLAAGHALLGWFGRSGQAAKPAAAALGMPLTTYTAVLLSNTSIPVWHEARRELPFVFAGGSVASAGAAAALLTPPERAGPARRLTLLGTALEACAVLLMERRLGELGEPYRQGTAGRLTRLAKAVGWSGGLAVGLAGRRRGAVIGGGVAALAGAVLERWSVFRAGFQSAQDPKHTVGPQRRRMEEQGSLAFSPGGIPQT